MRYKCELGGIPEVNEMLRQIASANGINTYDSDKQWDNDYPFILFDSNTNHITQCNSIHSNIDLSLPLPNFIQLLKGGDGKKTTIFAGRSVTLNKDGLIVGCHSFKINEVKEFLKFLNEHIK